MKVFRMMVGAVVVAMSAASVASAATADHLQCFKIKDDAAAARYVATLTPTDPAFAPAPGCTIKVPAKLLCVDTVKSAVDPAPPGAPEGAAAQTYLCYKTRCPVTAATATMGDQFGLHNLTVIKTGLLCAPVDTSAATTTSTTTTTLATGCVQAADCPGVDTECSARTCTLGDCGVDFAVDGQAVASQIAGDCRTNVCNGTGGVRSAVNDTDLPADDGNSCTSEICTSGAPNHLALDGTPCSQNGGTTCSSGTCATRCGDGAVSNGEACDDGNVVNGDGCDNNCTFTNCGNGVRSGAEQCDDGNLVNGDGCDSNCKTTSCGNGIVTGVEQCDDGNLVSGDGCDADCTITNLCAGVNCSALDQCHVAGTCDPDTGTCINPAKADGTSCNDGDACTQTDTCQGGTCGGANPVTCSASDPCHAAGTCNPATGTCSNPTVADGSTCNDGDACTQTDACQGGTCTGGNPVVCGGGADACHPGVCNNSDGSCSYPSMCELYGVGSLPSTLVDGLVLSPATLEDGTSNNAVGAFGSAIAYTGVGNLYLATPDRGPNNGLDSYTDRYYQLEITLSGGVVTPRIVGATTLKRDPSTSFVGLLSQFDATNSPSSRRLDPEGVRVSPQGTFYVSDEYGPFLYEFGADGTRLRSLDVPARFLIDNPSATNELPPTNTKGRQNNRGMEGLAISPDGQKLYGLMQNPLIQDGALNGSNSRVGLNDRLLEIDVTTGATREFLYKLNDKSYGLNELVAVNDHQFIAIERDGNAGNAAAFKRLFLIDIAGATDISAIASLPTSTTPAGVVPVAKRQLLDLLAPEYGLAGSSFPEKIEGLAFGPDLPDGRHVLLVTNDNDFLSTNRNNVYAFAIDTAVLPGYQAATATFSDTCSGVTCTAADACDLPGSCQPATGTCSTPSLVAGTLVGTQTTGDCQSLQCDGAGNIVTAADNNDLPDDGNQCTANTCSGGAPSFPALNAGTPCSQGGGNVCNGGGACVVCLLATDCPGVDTNCSFRTCNSGTCGTGFASAGTPTASQVVGDCESLQCDGTGVAVPVADDADLPIDGNLCTNDVCTAGVPTNPPTNVGSSCGSGQVCDGNGGCSGCNTSADCPGTDTECAQRNCSAGNCGWVYAADGTVVASQSTGDCQRNECDGSGAVVARSDGNDVPNDANQCTQDLCSLGTPSHTNTAAGTVCSQNGGHLCDGSGACIEQTFRIVRIGTGSAALGTTGTAGFIEERRIDGTLVGSSLALPTAASGANSPLTFSGTASSDGEISRSADGHYLVVGGYAATPGTVGVSGTATAGTNRVVARINTSNAIDTSTKFTTAFNANNFRGVATTNGSDIWGSGAGGSTAGTWYIPFGTSGGTQVSNLNTRWLGIFGGQLFGTSNQSNFSNVFAIGSGTPTTTGQTTTALSGMPAGTAASPFGFVMLDRDASPGVDTLYLADDGATGGVPGIQKWTKSGSTWSLASRWTSVTGLSGSISFRGVAAVPSGNAVVVLATTVAATTDGNSLVVFTDTGSGTPTGSVVATAAANTVYRGVAPSPY